MRKKVILVLFTIMLSIPSLLIAQTDPPDFPGDVDDVPFDGGVSVLIAAGIAYGLKKAYDNKRQKNYTDTVK